MAATSKADKTIPNLENATPGFLVDEIGRMRVESARLKFLDGVYKQALEARLSDDQKAGIALIEGERFIGSRIEQRQERVDTEAVKAYFADNPQLLAKMYKEIKFWMLDAKAKVTEF